MRILFAIALFAWTTSSGAQQETTLGATEDFFRLLSSGSSVVGRFHPEARVLSLTGSDAEPSTAQWMSVAEYEKDLQNLRQEWSVTLIPVVIHVRHYGRSSTVLCSVWMRLVNTGNDTLYGRSMQSIKWLLRDGQWRIQHLGVHNEVPGIPLDRDFWPNELAGRFPLNASMRAVRMGDDREPYDETRIYALNEVDEPPVYPLDGDVFERLLSSFGVSTVAAPGRVPVKVIIGEDGGATMDENPHLSAASRARADSFVRSMMVWYPAIRDAASVKCELIFYLNE